jgi:hypothetical protein
MTKAIAKALFQKWLQNLEGGKGRIAFNLCLIHADYYVRMLVARLHLLRMAKSRRPNQLQAVLKALSPDLDETYDESLDRIASQDRELAFEAFSWIALTQRPLKLTELLHAIATRWDDEEQNYIDEGDLDLPERILEVCQGLIVSYGDEFTLVRKSPLIIQIVSSALFA